MIQLDNESTRADAARIIFTGGVIAFRTDTFYGLGADPLNAGAVEKIHQLKGREEGKPILVLISDTNQIDRFIADAEAYKRVAMQYWPAALTLVGAARAEIPSALTAGTGTIGIRLPNDEDVCSLVRACGGALTATSANAAGKPPARTAHDVENYFGAGVDLIFDGGTVTVTEPSTVVDVSVTPARLIREGAVSLRQLKPLIQ